jgi:uncharacterized membrane protein
MTGTWFLILKSLHIVSVVLFLGNIITGVFWKVHGDRSGTMDARVQALDGVTGSDRVFTMPGVMLTATESPSPCWRAIRCWHAVDPVIVVLDFGPDVLVPRGAIAEQMLANTRAPGGDLGRSAVPETVRRVDILGAVATGAPLIAVFLMVMKPV